MPLSPKSKRLLVKAMRAGRRHGETLRAAGRTLSAASAFLPGLRGPARLIGRLLYLGGTTSKLLSALRGKGGKQRRLVVGGRGRRGGHRRLLGAGAARQMPQAPPRAPDAGGLSDAERKQLEKQLGKGAAAEVEKLMGRQGTAQPRQVPTAAPAPESPAPPRRMPTTMPSAERRTPAPRTLPAEGAPEAGGPKRQLPGPEPREGGPRRVPWTGWQSQLRDRGGRWTGEQLEGAGEKPSGFGGQGESGGERLDDLTESLDNLTEAVNKLIDVMGGKETGVPKAPGQETAEVGDMGEARALGAVAGKSEQDVSADSDMDFARGLGGVLKALPEILAALA